MGIQFDPVNKHILITSPTTLLTTLEIYNTVMDWCDEQDTISYSIPMMASGKFGMGGGVYSDSIFVLTDGWKIKPWSGDYQLTIIGTIITDDETPRTIPPDSGNVETVFQVSSQATVVVQGSGITQQDKEDIADEVWVHATGVEVSSDLDNPDQYKADISSLALEASVQSIQADLDNPTQYQADLTNLTTLTEAVKKMLTNRLKIDESTNTMTIYEDNGTTPLIVFNLKNKEGAPASEGVYERVPQ